MEFKELQKKVLKRAKEYCEENNIKLDKNLALLKLYEELGELTQAVLIFQKKSRLKKQISKQKARQGVAEERVAEEMVDVLGTLIVNAYLWNIDLEKTIDKKWISKIIKKKKKPISDM